MQKSAQQAGKKADAMAEKAGKIAGAVGQHEIKAVIHVANKASQAETKMYAREYDEARSQGASKKVSAQYAGQSTDWHPH